MCRDIIMPSYMSKYPIIYCLQKNPSTYSILYDQCKPLYTSREKFSAINTQFIVCPVTGLL